MNPTATARHSALLNKDLRRKILEMIYKAGEGHVPSAFSIIDIIAYLYGHVLKFDGCNPRSPDRDYFILSKGHGSGALYVVLARHHFLAQSDLDKKSKKNGILGGHPDCTRVPGVEASTGSLGHGIATAVGIALGLRIKGLNNKVIVLVGDGECNEGTVWECALVAANLQLGNLCVIVDNNGSAAQILPVANAQQKFESFGWQGHTIDGHSERELEEVFQKISFQHHTPPKVIVANTIKGKGVSFMEGHGTWHAKVPNAEEFAAALRELT